MNLKRQRIKNILIIIFGNFSLAVGTSLFVLPHNIVNGGTSGLSLVIEGFFGFNPSVSITIITWLLFFIGFVILGKKFAIKTLLSTILYPAFINVFTNVNYFVELSKEVTNSLLATLVGSVLVGFGLGIVYREGASTGGFDVISLILKKYFKIKLSVSTFVIDTTIIVLALASLSLENALYGLLCVLVTSYIIEKITISGTSSYMAHIVSDKIEEINNYLINELERGTTLIKGEGGLTRKDKLMIEVVFNEKEYYDIKKNIFLIDSKAFISVYKSINAYGYGFDEEFFRGN